MVKVFTTNNNGKIEFTKDELEKLLNEVWQDGYNSNTSYWWSSPNSLYCSNGAINGIKLEGGTITTDKTTLTYDTNK